MSNAIQLDVAGLHSQMQRLAVATRKTTEEVIANQMGLLLRDSIRFTAPFGDAPITEKFAAQKAIGLKAVASNIQDLFVAVEDMKLYRAQSDIGKRVRELHRKKNMVGLEALLHRAGYKQELIDSANADLHEKNRNSWGRVNVRRARYLVMKKASIAKLVRSEQKKVGLAKSGWMPAINRINTMRKTPIATAGWIRSQPGTGYLVRLQQSGKVGFESANTVPYIQKHEQHIMKRAEQNRARNLAKEVAIAEQAYAAALRRASR